MKKTNKDKEQTLVWIVIGVVVLLFLTGSGMMGWGGYGGMTNMMSGNYGSGMMFFSWLYGVLILIALVLFIVWLIKQVQK